MENRETIVDSKRKIRPSKDVNENFKRLNMIRCVNHCLKNLKLKRKIFTLIAHFA